MSDHAKDELAEERPEQGEPAKPKRPAKKAAPAKPETDEPKTESTPAEPAEQEPGTGRLRHAGTPRERACPACGHPVREPNDCPACSLPAAKVWA